VCVDSAHLSPLQLLAKRHALLARREALQAAVRELGSLPSTAFEQVRVEAASSTMRVWHGQIMTL
jgi:hypothetical protein